MSTYAEIYKDWEYLFKTVGEANDMTGGYVDSEDLEMLLKNPSKVTARNCLYRQIQHWFHSGIDYVEEHRGKSLADLIAEYPEIETIAISYGFEIEKSPNPFCRYRP